MARQIIVGTDGSKTADEAVKQAGELAVALHAGLTIVRAYSEREPHNGGSAYDPTVDEGAATAGLPSDVARPVGRRAEVLGDLEAAVAAAKQAGVSEVVAEAREGDPADVILTLAEETNAAVIVVGNKGMTGGRRFLLGSVPNKITHHAPCNVYVVHTT